jgi:DNA-binding response OmpR family regulator
MDRIADMIDRYPGLGRGTAALMVVLMDGRGRVLSYDHIVEHISLLIGWDYSYETLGKTISMLRRVLANHDMTITTIYGVGIRLNK